MKTATMKRRSAKGSGNLFKRDKDGTEHPADWNGVGIFCLRYTVQGKRFKETLRNASGQAITIRSQAEAERRRILAPYQTGDEVETLNHADSMTYEIEKQLRENGDKLSSEDKATVEKELADFKAVRERNNAEEIKTAMEAMTQKVYAIFGKIYQQQGGADGASGADGANGADGGDNAGGAQPNTQNDDGSFNADGSVQ